MSDREQYEPGPASGAQIQKDGENWTLVLTRELHHSPEKVWQAKQFGLETHNRATEKA